ncbi:MAG: hypothetical protein M0R77_02460 [Gammaproteobacteria bacterium]|nr:hypothetical protein [Gammaproteobacteria bacterium]
MTNVIFRFLKPNSFVGRLISWRLGEPWSHVCIIIDDAAYSAQIPWTVMLPLSDKSVAVPPRRAFDLQLTLHHSDIEKLKAWCESKVGSPYDFLSIIGWFFGWSWLQNKRNSYCFEYCFQALVYMGWIKEEDKLIKGNKLIEDIESVIEMLEITFPCEVHICKYN